MGAAVHAGLFDLDTPLAIYNVTPTCDSGPKDCWRALCPECPSGPLGFWPNQTARTLLSQASGCVTGQGCFRPPGEAFTVSASSNDKSCRPTRRLTFPCHLQYDSETYIQHLAHLVGARVRASNGTARTAVAWASQLMAKLGLPDFYGQDDLGDEFAAGGGQQLSCRGGARLAQLVLNRGLWPSSPGNGPSGGDRTPPERLLGEAYVQEMLSPQFARRGFSYGFLTWLNAKRSAHVTPAHGSEPRVPDPRCSNFGNH